MVNQHRNNPFPGLRSFDFEEHHLFFGREKHVADLLRKLYNHHFVAVVGTSGSGKSSLIRAGLLPSIQKGLMAEGQETWFIATMKPGTTPMDNLVSAINESGVLADQSPEVGERLQQYVEKSSLGLIQGVRASLLGNRKLLLLVDQFEELFRYREVGDEHFIAEASAFVQLIIDSITQKDVPIYVVLTLRSDFLGDCVTFEGLPEAINDGHYLVPRLNKEQNKEAITRPVDYAGGKISPRLVQTLINDLNDDPDQLPVMQHALMRTWDYWENNAATGEPMEVEHYQAIGGMDNALSRHADEAFFELESERLREVARMVFQCITVKSSGNRGIRRPTAIRQICAITKSTEQEVLAAMQPFRQSKRSFVVPGLDRTLSSDSVLDISHESLMRGWERLANWVDDETASAEIFTRLSENALLYQEGQSGLYRNPELQIAVNWQKSHNPNKEWANQYNLHFDYAMAFLESSIREHEAELKRKSRQRLILRTAVVIFLLTVSSLTIWALFQTDVARENSVLAEQKANEALKQKQLAENARKEAESSSIEALEAKALAEHQSDIALSQEKLALLRKQEAEKQALLATKYGNEALSQKQLADQQRQEALKQKQLAENSEKEAKRLRMVSIGQNLAFKSIQIQDDPQLAGLLAFHSFGMIDANSGNTFDPQVHNALYKSLQIIAPSYKSTLLKVTSEPKAIYANGNALQVIQKNGNIASYSTLKESKLPETVLPNNNSGINTAYLLQNGLYSALGTDNFHIKLYAQSGNKLLCTLEGHRQLVRSVDVDPSGKLVASGGRDSTVIIWKDAEILSQMRFNSRIRKVLFTADFRHVLVGTEDGKLSRIQVENGEITELLQNKNARALDICTSPDGKHTAVSFSDGVVHVLSEKGGILHTINERRSVDFIQFDEVSENLIAVVGLNKIKVFKLNQITDKPLEILSNVNINSLCVHSGTAYVSCSDNTIRQFPYDVSSIRERLRTKLKRPFTQEEWNTYVGPEIPLETYGQSATN